MPGIRPLLLLVRAGNGSKGMRDEDGVRQMRNTVDHVPMCLWCGGAVRERACEGGELGLRGDQD